MNVKKELYEAFSPPGSMKKERFLSSLPYPKLGFPSFVLLQTKYIRKRFWVVSAMIVAYAVCMVFFMPREELMHIKLSDVWSISSMTPFLAMLTAAEISRSNIYGTAELEASCRFSLPQLTGARTLILGTVSFAVILVPSVITGIFTPVGIARSVLYILTPFLFTNGITLAVFSRFSGQEGIYISSAAAVIVSVFGVPMQFSAIEIPEGLYCIFSILLCIIGAVTIFYNLKKIMNGAKFYGTQA